MCGRFTLKVKPGELEADPFQVVDVPDLPDRYNVAPSQTVAVIRPDGGVRRLSLLRWGLVPHWEPPSEKPRAFANARSEGAASRPVFRDAFRRRRCLIPTTGFYEWLPATPGKPKQPYLFRLLGGRTFAFAGLWDEWHGPDGEPLQTCTTLTTDANETVRPVHAHAGHPAAGLLRRLAGPGVTPGGREGALAPLRGRDGVLRGQPLGQRRPAR